MPVYLASQLARRPTYFHGRRACDSGEGGEQPSLLHRVPSLVWEWTGPIRSAVATQRQLQRGGGGSDKAGEEAVNDEMTTGVHRHHQHRPRHGPDLTSHTRTCSFVLVWCVVDRVSPRCRLVAGEGEARWAARLTWRRRTFYDQRSEEGGRNDIKHDRRK